MSEQYPWYCTIDASTSIEQGDFVYSCPIVVPVPEMLAETSIRTKVRRYNVIVMSQSCDLKYGKIDLVLVCPVWTLSKVGEENPFYRSTAGKESLRRGNVPGYHLLDKCHADEFVGDYLVVDFRNVHGVPFSFLAEFVKRHTARLRLLPPYREHLSQAFARFFMRVGLPVDIPPFK